MHPARLFFTACAMAGPAWGGGTAVLNIGCGHLFDQAGISAANRLPVDTLCVLVADMAGDGFDPPGTGWVADDDVLVLVSDVEFPASAGGTKGFDLASGTTEPGFFSRSLIIDLAPFAGRTRPVPLALRWFPGCKARETDVTAAGPAAGSAYGEFTRAVPAYPATGSTGWLLPLAGGENVTLDPFVTVESGGTDPPEQGMASRITGVPAGAAPAGLVLRWNSGGTVTLDFSGAAGLKYTVQRSMDLITWPDQWTVTAGAGGTATFTDTAPPSGRAFYRVAGPL
ncbi:MAG: hypothetical protein V4726_01090 [Verrucomicrobiota bacterium]